MIRRVSLRSDGDGIILKSFKVAGFVSLRAFVLQHLICTVTVNSLMTCQSLLIKVWSWSHSGDLCRNRVTTNNATGTNGNPLTAGARASEENQQDRQRVREEWRWEGLTKASQGWLNTWKCNQFLTCWVSHAKFLWVQRLVATSCFWGLRLEKHTKNSN